MGPPSWLVQHHHHRIFLDELHVSPRLLVLPNVMVDRLLYGNQGLPS